MKKKLLQLIAIAGFIFTTQALIAQAPPSGGGQPQGQPPASGAPIDGGASLLLVGAAGYAYKRLKAKKGE
ncbi:MAG: hypothetical protein U0V74_05990 [Chitinophagales bacterium]